MYRIIDVETGEVIKQADEIRFVKLKNASRAWVRTDFFHAECVVIDGVRFSLSDRDKVDDAPVVEIQRVDAAQIIKKQEDDLKLLSQALTMMAEEIVNNLEL